MPQEELNYFWEKRKKQKDALLPHESTSISSKRKAEGLDDALVKRIRLEDGVALTQSVEDVDEAASSDEEDEEDLLGFEAADASMERDICISSFEIVTLLSI